MLDRLSKLAALLALALAPSPGSADEPAASSAESNYQLHLTSDPQTCECEGCRAYRARISGVESSSHLESASHADSLLNSDMMDCDCPGCQAYRSLLEQGIFITDLAGESERPGEILLAQAAPLQPEDIQAPLAPPTQGAGSQISVTQASSVTSAPAFENFLQELSAAASDPETLAAIDRPGATVISAQTASLIAAPETGTILRDAGPSNSVTLQRRNTVSYDPHVRGFRYGQVLSRVGGVWSPVRPDLDSPISKLDPSLIESITVIPGPYAAQYGPAFSYIDVATVMTPRYADGYESHVRVGETYRENRGQQHGRATVYGGGSDWGFIGHYGSRTGSDYRSGDNTLIPSSYHNQSKLAQLGFDLTNHSSIEVRYDRLDQTDTEYALQFWDIDFLGSDSTSVRYVDVDPGGVFSQVNVDLWYNRTRYYGGNTISENVTTPSKAPVVDRVRSALTEGLPASMYDDVQFFGTTFGDRLLTGGRFMLTMGDVADVHSRIGADYRFEDQEIQEDFWIYGNFPADPADSLTFYTNLPKSWLDDVGVFDELVIPVNSYWTTTIGARVDMVTSNARVSDLRPTGNLYPDRFELSQADTLYSFYYINDVLLTTNWSTRFGFGHGQRQPSLLERYSDGVFLGIIQSGFSRVIGDPTLDKERLWQVDWGVTADYDDFRARFTVFDSWVLDFSTYSGNAIESPDGARLLTSVNTPLATLAGFELYGEADVSEYVTLFSAMNYVQGTDQSIDRPLWGVAPLQGRTGIRLHDGDGGQTWGSELSLRMVDDQSRFGIIRVTGAPGALINVEQPTAGFSTVDLRNYYNVTRNTNFIFGVENLLDKNYLEHLDLRLQEQLAPPTGQGIPDLPAVAALSPGITLYMGVEIVN